jgi:outer membrane immunogenic protein
MNRSSLTLKALTAALILASTTGMVFAKGYKGDFKGEACPPPQMLKTGWYLGAQVGYDSYRVRNSFTGTIAGVGVAGNPVLDGTGWVGGLFLGYGMMMNDWFYLGGEVFGNASGVNQNTSFVTSLATGSNVSTNFQVNGSYGLGLLPGVKMTDSTLTFVRLGWNWANLKSKASFTDTALVPPTVSGSKTNTSNGFVFGVGMETLIVDNWSLRGEFDHTWYSNYNAGTAIAPAFATTSVSPSDNQYMLALMYHFG